MVLIPCNTHKTGCVIIGGNLAGLAAGIETTGKGVDTIIVEKNPIGKTPVQCGEGVIDQIIYDHDYLSPSHDYIANPVRNVSLRIPGDRSVDVHLKNRRGYIMHRDRLQQHMADEFKKRGGTILRDKAEDYFEKDGTVVLKSGDIIKTRTIVFADGIRSIGHEHFGIDRLERKDKGVCLQYTVETTHLDSDRLIVEWGIWNIPGYIWVFPKGKYTANIGIGVTCDYDGNPRELLERFLNQRYPDWNPKARIGGLLPLSMPVEKPALRNMYLIGDAARAVLAYSGAGIGLALMTGKDAGRNIGNYTSADVYNDLWKKKYHKKLVRAYKVKEKLINEPRYKYQLYYIAKTMSVLFKLAPSIVADYAFRRIRY